ncbi:unnamed protein product [Cuscuta campestris]|uniref:Uncharacterized protein n=1 Tax=Cuscuta campestris TaxID=132261 RepID=A0A484L9S2_9ASTE|nr:unnamed protein product [Cuscuta campestris]
MLLRAGRGSSYLFPLLRALPSGRKRTTHFVVVPRPSLRIGWGNDALGRRQVSAHAPKDPEQKLSSPSYLERSPPTPPINLASGGAHKAKKRKEAASASATPRGSESPHMTDFGHPSPVKVAFPLLPSFSRGEYEPKPFLWSFTPPPDREVLRDADSKVLTSTSLRELGSAAMRFAEVSQRPRLTKEDRTKAHAEMAAFHEKMVAAEECARQAEERA